MLLQDENEAAQLLFAAARSGNRLANLPEHLQPANLADVYEIQDALIRMHGAIGGWKVAPAKEPGKPPRCTPIPAAQIYPSPRRFSEAHLFPLEIEVEIAVVFGADLPARADAYTSPEVAAAVASINPSFEIVGSRFSDRKSLSALTTLADLHGNAAVVYAAGSNGWPTDELADRSVTLSIDGKVVSSKNHSSPTTAETLDLLVGVANHATKRTGGVKAGQLVITGARIKLGEVKPGSLAEAAFEGMGSVSATFG